MVIKLCNNSEWMMVVVLIENKGDSLFKVLWEVRGNNSVKNGGSNSSNSMRVYVIVVVECNIYQCEERRIKEE